MATLGMPLNNTDFVWLLFEAVWLFLKSCLFEAALGIKPKPWAPENPGEVLSNLTQQHTFWFRFCQPYPLLQPTHNKTMLPLFFFFFCKSSVCWVRSSLWLLDLIFFCSCTNVRLVYESAKVTFFFISIQIPCAWVFLKQEVYSHHHLTTLYLESAKMARSCTSAPILPFTSEKAFTNHW